MGYPAGPYGSQVGDVIPNLDLTGYIRFETTGLASDAAASAASLGDVRSQGTRDHIIIHVAGYT